MIRTIIPALVGGAILLLALRSLRAHRLKERYVLQLCFTGLPFLALAIWPNAVGWVARVLEIDYRTVVVLVLATFMIVMLFELFSIVSVQERRIATLAQMVGMMMEKKAQGHNDEAP